MSHSHQIEELILPYGYQFQTVCVQSVGHTAQGPTHVDMHSRIFNGSLLLYHLSPSQQEGKELVTSVCSHCLSSLSL